jgi:hypothetical protein
LVEEYGGVFSLWFCIQRVFTLYSVFVQATVDGGSETGELYAAHLALR